MIILGIDPGLALVGYGIISTTKPKHQKQDKNEKPKVVDFGCITTTTLHSPGKRLYIIHQEVNALIKIPPQKVKRRGVGYGRAKKKQVQEMTRQLLDLSSFDIEEKDRKKDDA